GLAVGRDSEGIVYFVEGGVPGDVVDVLVTRKKSAFRKGFVVNYKSYSEEREEPLCEHFGNCGGCKWQNLKYDSQLKYKEESVLNAFKRIGHLEIGEKRPIIGCENIFVYRNKMEYSFAYRRWIPKEELEDKEVEVSFDQAVGFHRAGAFDKVVQIDKCHLQDDLSNQIRNSIHKLATENNWTYYNARSHEGFLRNLRVRNTTLGEWMIVIIFGENNEEDITVTLNHIDVHFPDLTSVYYVVNTKMNDTINDLELTLHSGKPTITEQLGHIKYNIGPKSFFQTNTKQAELLYDQIKILADLKGDELVYDLYTGLGSIALYLANSCRAIVGIEEIKEAIDDANLNKSLNQIDNAHFEVGDVKDQFNSGFVKKYGQADLIIVDPPRAGLHGDVVEMLNQTNAPKIIYVSCNPATQARDIGLMSEKYDVDLIQPVDMFPHTHHIENIAVLTKK
ncbi:MAG: 23S rRNA (uracil(1939)-C(5))-methyltransferase RlmD, partial [Saprospiraceae bacterium]|nr:23S rRNA (uracil(1939)-C(5))-methyltransferase RlmD [Bacteroidia bacterium]NNL93600.1 23S rRNA (uracil(1939)-C(5))-methyltransferase RlmD [Saprospiraceae bacterium]